MRDEIVRLNAGAVRGRAVHGRDDLHEAVLHGDLDAEPAELAAGLGLHVAEILDVEKCRVRIERRQHAVDRALDHLGFIGLLDILRAHMLEDVAEQIELPVDIGARGVCRRVDQNAGLREGDGGYCARQRAYQK
jgi:hypothetical protein